ncbi:MAG TPA: NYN domain-containing protein [Gemmatimonadales bacterium]|nr:NYN domain-containing protein [Gemmatimonadales bacterium]
MEAPPAALLIDFENVTVGVRSSLTDELSRLLKSEIVRGEVAVQRAYADWRRFPQFIGPLAETPVELVFAPSYGSANRHASIMRLATDALELVFTRPELGVFILLSGNSELSTLVFKLKEHGKRVIGVGNRGSASTLLRESCDEYYLYDDLIGLDSQNSLESR